MIAGRLVLAAVLLVAGLAVYDSLRGRSPGPVPKPAEMPALERGLRQDDDAVLPARGALSSTLYFQTLSGCRLGALDLVAVAPGPLGPPTACGLWVSPQGDLAAVPRPPAHASRARVLWLARLDGTPRLDRPLGTLTGEVSWSRDGSLLAWCEGNGDSVVLTVATGARRTVLGCRPKIAPDGTVLTRPHRPITPLVLRDGDVILDAARLDGAFDAGASGVIDVLGYDQRGDGLLAVASVRYAGGAPELVVQFWKDGNRVGAVGLPPLGMPGRTGRFGEVLSFSPGGNELAVAFPGAGVRVLVVDVASGEIVRPPTSQHGFAWSPDGSWFALSTGEDVLVFGRTLTTPVYVLPVGASAIAWR